LSRPAASKSCHGEESFTAPFGRAVIVDHLLLGGDIASYLALFIE